VAWERCLSPVSATNLLSRASHAVAQLPSSGLAPVLTAATFFEALTIRLYSERLEAVLSDAESPLLARQPRMPGAV